MCKHCGDVKARIGDYKILSMCPFTIAQVGGGGGFGGFSSEHYTWKHGPCLGAFCALWDVADECCYFKSAALSILGQEVSSEPPP